MSWQWRPSLSVSDADRFLAGWSHQSRWLKYSVVIHVTLKYNFSTCIGKGWGWAIISSHSYFKELNPNSSWPELLSAQSKNISGHKHHATTCNLVQSCFSGRGNLSYPKWIWRQSLLSQPDIWIYFSFFPFTWSTWYFALPPQLGLGLPRNKSM